MFQAYLIIKILHYFVIFAKMHLKFFAISKKSEKLEKLSHDAFDWLYM